MNEWLTWIYIYSCIENKGPISAVTFCSFPCYHCVFGHAVSVFYLICQILSDSFWRTSAITAVLYTRSASWEMFTRNICKEFPIFWLFSPSSFFFVCVIVYSVSWRILHIVKIYGRTAYIVNCGFGLCTVKLWNM